ncbi:hypothetical protein P171DRAFT_482613 [Karstenula rhodostoma CBS 690.94]|uniref:Uncharacterized protein n=1 Tax=Karstenula rhodostoma CBS 690.94 TaxID=1392251 RepID=A0A9P4PML4_9PLEO|nr:hypothetical protein P171DRAFT_482613 [Karstenula rhodostoma CBS 690.94]
MNDRSAVVITPQVNLDGTDEGFDDLLSTPLTGKDLTANVQKLSFAANSWSGKLTLYKRAPGLVQQVEAVITAITKRLPPYFTKRWLQSASDQPTHDAILALIFWLATDLEQLDFTFTKEEEFPLTKGILGWDWRLVSPNLTAPRPFWKLENFRLICNGHLGDETYSMRSCISITPSLEHVSLNRISTGQDKIGIYWPLLTYYLHAVLGTLLKTLEIHNVNFKMKEIELLFDRLCL